MKKYLDIEGLKYLYSKIKQDTGNSLNSLPINIILKSGTNNIFGDDWITAGESKTLSNVSADFDHRIVVNDIDISRTDISNSIREVSNIVKIDDYSYVTGVKTVNTYGYNSYIYILYKSTNYWSSTTLSVHTDDVEESKLTLVLGVTKFKDYIYYLTSSGELWRFRPYRTSSNNISYDSKELCYTFSTDFTSNKYFGNISSNDKHIIFVCRTGATTNSIYYSEDGKTFQINNFTSTSRPSWSAVSSISYNCDRNGNNFWLVAIQEQYIYLYKIYENFSVERVTGDNDISGISMLGAYCFYYSNIYDCYLVQDSSGIKLIDATTKTTKYIIEGITFNGTYIINNNLFYITKGNPISTSSSSYYGSYLNHVKFYDYGYTKKGTFPICDFYKYNTTRLYYDENLNSLLMIGNGNKFKLFEIYATPDNDVISDGEYIKYK